MAFLKPFIFFSYFVPIPLFLDVTRFYFWGYNLLTSIFLLPIDYNDDDNPLDPLPA